MSSVSVDHVFMHYFKTCRQLLQGALPQALTRGLPDLVNLPTSLKKSRGRPCPRLQPWCVGYRRRRLYYGRRFLPGLVQLLKTGHDAVRSEMVNIEVEVVELLNSHVVEWDGVVANTFNTLQQQQPSHTNTSSQQLQMLTRSWRTWRSWRSWLTIMNSFLFVTVYSPPPTRLCNARRSFAVCVSVCLSVCLLSTLRKTTQRIFTKILPPCGSRSRNF